MKKTSVFNIINYIVITAFSFACVLPLILVILVSFTDEAAIENNGYSYFPSKFSVAAYENVFTANIRNGKYLFNNMVYNSYAISIFITVAGTLLAVTITAMAAFTLSNKQVACRNKLSIFFIITMLFNAGLVPWYMINSALGLKENILALIVPNLLFSPFNLMLVRNFMRGIPDSLTESAKIDGANDVVIAFRIIIPLSIPVLAAVALFYAIGYWNDWFNAIMLVSNDRLYPLQYFLYNLQSSISAIQNLQRMGINAGATNSPPAESLKMATVVLTIGPIVFMYPFLQKYFVKGLVLGGVKG